MTLEGEQSHIWCSKIGWQTVPCSWQTVPCLWSIDGKAVLTISSLGAPDQQSPRRRGTQLLATTHGVGRHTQVKPSSEGLHRVDTSTQAPPSCRGFAGVLEASVS